MPASPVTAVLAWIAALDIGRDEARDRAARELSSPRYAEESSSIFRRVLDWIAERLAVIIDFASGGIVGRIVIAVLAIGLIAGIILAIVRSRPDARRRTATGEPIFGDTQRAAAQRRADADAAADVPDWETAVVERFRTIAAELEERGVVEPRAGRTAAELAYEAGTAMPPIRDDLAWATVLFDGVRYGKQRATHDDDLRLRRIDDTVRGDVRRRTSAPASGVTTLEPPR